MISGVSGSSDYWQMMVSQTQRTSAPEVSDSNGDGSVNVIEVKAFAEKASEMTGQAVMGEDVMVALDKDKDGQVSEEELDAGLRTGSPPATNGTGESQGADIKVLLDMITGSQDNQGSSPYSDPLDANRDGTVDTKEYEKGLNKLVLEYMKQAGFFGNVENNASTQLNLQV